MRKGIIVLVDPVIYLYEDSNNLNIRKKSLKLNTIINRVKELPIASFKGDIDELISKIIDAADVDIQTKVIPYNNEDIVYKTFHFEYHAEQDICTAHAKYPENDKASCYLMAVLDTRDYEEELKRHNIAEYLELMHTCNVDYLTEIIGIYVNEKYKNISIAKRYFLKEFVSMLAVKSLAGEVEYNYNKLAFIYNKLTDIEETPITEDFIQAIHTCFNNMMK